MSATLAVMNDHPKVPFSAYGLYDDVAGCIRDLKLTDDEVVKILCHRPLSPEASQDYSDHEPLVRRAIALYRDQGEWAHRTTIYHLIDERKGDKPKAPTTVAGIMPATLPDPAEMTDDQLAEAVIQVFAKIRDYLPYIVALKARFTDGERDSANHLIAPIKGCYSWQEFCKSILNRDDSVIRKAIAADKKPKEETHTVTEAEFAEYEHENQGIRKLTEKLLADGLPESDVVSALVNMEHPQEMAEAAVRVITAETASNPDGAAEIVRTLSQSIDRAVSPLSRADKLIVYRSLAARLQELLS